MSFGGPTQISVRPTPPDRGSFSLDHHGECAQYMRQYLQCLKDNNNNNKVCRPLAKEYLQCRMDRNLMDREEWGKLGFFDERGQGEKGPASYGQDQDGGPKDSAPLGPSGQRK
ncbi:Suppressor of Sensor Kinase (SLN1) [Spiromyces aspiralis]|uniref:Suppressor of Sensor Kinase (SLN1) n=1 Tax=Spiromyces aspiralis TaxID=68401 RepID=A0ACC1HL29_9FUNG|nr:Suppressor of Sensor Kinase (SLN1) [Spiromyces aspiralis]